MRDGVAQSGDNSAKLLLVGGGHAHVAVLADWITRGPPPGTSTVLLTPERYLRYSGMVPGWLAGQHERDEGLVDLAALAERAGAAWIADRCTSLDPAARRVTTARGTVIAFDHASLGTGGEGRAAALLGDDPRLIDVRPINAFTERLEALRASRRGLGRVVVAGGGAGGVELAFAIRNLAGADPRPQVTLVTGAAGLLPGFAEGIRVRTRRALARQGIALVAADVRIEGGRLLAGPRQSPFASRGCEALSQAERERPDAHHVSRPRSTRTDEGDQFSLEPVDVLIAALGSGAPGWVRRSGLAVDEHGFTLVDAQHRSTSHPHIFAAGDVAARADRPLAHSGVHAVFAGPVLAANLRALLTGQRPRAAYRPRAHSLYLLNTGDGRAIASYGPLAAEGRWVLALKHSIDKRWIAKYAALAKGE